MSGLDRNHEKEKGHIEIQTTPFPRDSNQGKANFEAQMLRVGCNPHLETGIFKTNHFQALFYLL